MSTNHTSSDAEAVYDACRSVPAGMVITYADLALLVGRPSSHSRTVSTILGHRPGADDPNTDIPWWRVVRTDGTCSTSTRSRGRGLSGSVGRSTSSPTRAFPSWARGRADVSTCAKLSGCPSLMASPRGWPRRSQVQVEQRAGRSERPCRAGVTRRSSTHAAIARPGAPDTPGWPSRDSRDKGRRRTAPAST